MEMDLKKKLNLWFSAFENFKNDLTTYENKKGIIFIFYFLLENILFLVLSIVYFVIKFMMLFYQVIIMIFVVYVFQLSHS